MTTSPPPSPHPDSRKGGLTAPPCLRRATTAALVVSVVIVATGGAARLNDSGLGCPTWPTCTGESLNATARAGWRGIIELGNHLLTYVLATAVGWVILAARHAGPGRRDVLLLGWGQFAVIVAGALLGGVTAFTGLTPYAVVGHFLLSTALITLACLTRSRTALPPAPAAAASAPSRTPARTLLTTGILLTAWGTAVTGLHAGPWGTMPHLSVDWATATRMHSVLGWTVLALALLLHLHLHRTRAPGWIVGRTRLLLAALAGQGALRYAQSTLGVPEQPLALPLLGSCLTAIAVLHATVHLTRAPGPPTGGKGGAEA
ncbi:heme A synthase [Streptomyces sp. YPW6]|uniref:COX15/CtaA family protein n=1 Tax=Streptomyces sp. YPW6 TaxID=2840373 RepID=UPI001C0D65EE|nr:COX15/CtaA family protein [Streptomyces sp. YPW6]QWQ45136.1 heme A synthase [Streptomyces sp. YPW6]